MKDLTGKRVGRLVAVCPTNKKKNHSIVWECRCDCGKIVKLSSSIWGTGRIKSCGCWLKERTSQLEYNGNRYSFKEFAQMHNLSTQIVGKRWKRGVRGEDLTAPPGTLPRKKYKIKQEDVYLDEDGSVISFSDLAKELGMSRWGVMIRYFAGDRGDRLRRQKGTRSYPKDKTKKHYNKTKRKVEYNGRKVSLSELAYITRIPYGTLTQRYKKGYRGDMLVLKTIHMMKKETNNGQE